MSTLSARSAGGGNLGATESDTASVLHTSLPDPCEGVTHETPAVQTSGQPFVGRRDELDVLRAALREARSGRPQVIVVQGQTGVGKTALVERFLRSEGDLQVLRADGERLEALVSFGVVDQLIRAVDTAGARVLIGHEPVPSVDEPAKVGARLLTLLAELEVKGPVVLVVDDAHWADIESLRALLFALRRLVAGRVLSVLVVRDDDEGDRLPDGFRRLACGQRGATVTLQPLTVAEVRELTAAVRDADLAAGLAMRLHEHTRGNPCHLRALLAELPAEPWFDWEPVLPAPRAYARSVQRRLEACRPPVRRLVEASSVLGDDVRLSTVAALAGVEEPLATLEEASVVGLLEASAKPGTRDVRFPHPLVRAAIYHELGPARRVGLHLAAASLLEDQAAALRHRVAAADPPDERLAAELADLAEREQAAGAFGAAASTLMQASRMSPPGAAREERLLRAVDILASAGGPVQADPFMGEVAGLSPGPRRDAVLGLLAILRGRPAEAEERLHRAWDDCDPDQDAELAAVIAQRRALHSVGRMRAADIAHWAGRASELALSDGSRIESQALRGLGLGWLGRTQEGLRVHDIVLDTVEGGANSVLTQPVRAANGALRVGADDLEGARMALSEATLFDGPAGSKGNVVWAFVWQARASFLLGAWDEAALAAEHAVALQEEARHEWFRPLARWTAVCVPAARGDWPVAERHVQMAAAQAGDYDLMIVAAALARAHLATARADHDAVLRALEPVLAIRPREAIDEPGFWPWQALYGDALVSAGRLAEAAAFLEPHEKLAAARGRLSTIAALARVRGRLEAATGRSAAAEAAFRHGQEQTDQLALPFEQALLELSYGQMLRRLGRRRAAAAQLKAAHEGLAQLGARPYLEQCERELSACGMAPAKRHALDPTRLTAQEFAVARLVAAGMSNRQVAAELYLSIKTVQFHLTHIYAKLQLSCRSELAANYEMLLEAQPRED